MANRVEILTRGAKRRVLIDGHELHQVQAIETPRLPGVGGPDVIIRFRASEVIDREVTDEEYSASPIVLGNLGTAA